MLVRSAGGGRPPDGERDAVEAAAGAEKPRTTTPSGSGGEARPREEGPVAEAAQQISQAEALYRAAAGKEGKEEDIEEAKRRLQRAQAILEDLPQDDPKVRELRIKRQQLHEDLIKVSNL